jgi:transcription elongation factor Elf1
MSSVITIKPTCPYCGHEVSSTDLDFGPRFVGKAIVTCGMCDREYTVYRNISVTYTSSDPEDDL